MFRGKGRDMTKILVALLVAAPTVAWACCAAPHAGENVKIADQEILVTWNAKTKQEHFVRRARFNGAEGKDFGFLVPTPTKPELHEAPDALFDRLAQLLLPLHVTKRVPDFTPWILRAFPQPESAEPPTLGLKSAGAMPRSAVTVLEEKRVAGFEAAVLEATDANALTEWLKAHEYSTNPEITDWATPYVAAKWKITAFKLPGGAPRVNTGAVRMSFTSERPLFPYRTAYSNRDGGGRLRVYYVGSERVTGTLGELAAEWGAGTLYSTEDPRLTKALEDSIPKDAMPEGLWLTAFDDHRWPSSGDDLFFGRAPDQSRVVPPPIVDEVKVPVPADLLGASVLGVVFFARRRRRKAA